MLWMFVSLSVVPVENFISLSFFFFYSFFLELGTEPRALHFLGKCFTTELNPQPPSVYLLNH
ncbi:rCG22439, partial [Rattus norvegicus]